MGNKRYFVISIVLIIFTIFGVIKTFPLFGVGSFIIFGTINIIIIYKICDKSSFLDDESVQDMQEQDLCDEEISEEKIMENLQKQYYIIEEQQQKGVAEEKGAEKIYDTEKCVEIEESVEEIKENIEYIETSESEEKIRPYKSERIVICGLHIYFISVAREILEQNAINIIPLMRKYNLSENDVNQIVCEMQESNVIDENNTPMMSLEEFERFLDIYEPGLFKCKNCIFDKKNFIDIGEIIFQDGAESVYDILPASEIIDYLNIMENLKIISYDNYKNKYDILVSKEEFYEICKSVPNFKKVENNTVRSIDIDDMDGHDFEHYCADILRKNGFENVEVTRGSGDHGIDILAEKNDIAYVIQCKRYSADIGNAAVQRAHTGKSIYKKDIAVVLTNRYFTAQAKEEAAALGVKLWDRDKLNSMIEKANS